MKNRKNELLIVLLLIMLMTPIASVIKFYSSSPWNTDCMLSYIRSGAKTGILYQLEGGEYHIEPDGSSLTNSLAPLSIWIADGCLMRTGNLYNDYNNTTYCSITKILLKKSF